MMKVSDEEYDRLFAAEHARIDVPVLYRKPKLKSLNLKEHYTGKHDRQQHVSNMRVRYNDDGTYCIWISNGNEKVAMFVMKPDSKKALIDFLQKF